MVVEDVNFTRTVVEHLKFCIQTNFVFQFVIKFKFLVDFLIVTEKVVILKPFSCDSINHRWLKRNLRLVLCIVVLWCFNGIWVNLGCLTHSGTIRDQQQEGVCCEFNFKTLYGNYSNSHMKTAFTHIADRWTHNIRSADSFSAIQLSTHSVFNVYISRLKSWNMKIKMDSVYGQLERVDPCCRQPLFQDWVPGHIITSPYRAKEFRSYKLCLTHLPVRST